MRFKKFTQAIVATAALSSSFLLGGCGSAAQNTSTPSVSIPASSDPSASSQVALTRDNSRTLTDPAEPKARVVLFTDYQCPYCAMMDKNIHQLATEYGDRVKIVVRNYPLQMHKNAPAAAYAVESAAEQGKFSEMSAKVFATQGDWKGLANPVDTFTGYAESLGLDMEKYRSDANSPAIKARVTQDLNDAQNLGLQSTPSVIVNTTLLNVNSQDYETLRAPVAQAMGEQ